MSEKHRRLDDEIARAVRAWEEMEAKRDELARVVKEIENIKRWWDDVVGERDRLAEQVRELRAALERIARIPTNLRSLGEKWVQRMAAHGAEARDTAKDALAKGAGAAR